MQIESPTCPRCRACRVVCLGVHVRSDDPRWASGHGAHGTGPRCADQRDFHRPLKEDEHARLALARLQLQQAELQLRIEDRRFDVAQDQLRVQVEKTATATAQLAVEEARHSVRQWELGLEKQQATSASLRASREVARHVDLDKQAAIAQLKKETAQLQFDAQKERAICEVDLEYQQREVARSYLGLQQARLRNMAPAKEKAEVDLALMELGVVSPAPLLQSELDRGGVQVPLRFLRG